MWKAEHCYAKFKFKFNFFYAPYPWRRALHTQSSGRFEGTSDSAKPLRSSRSCTTACLCQELGKVRSRDPRPPNPRQGIELLFSSPSPLPPSDKLKERKDNQRQTFYIGNSVRPSRGKRGDVLRERKMPIKRKILERMQHAGHTCKMLSVHARC